MADVKLKVDAGVVNARKSKQYSQESEAWAVGKVDGVDVPSDADQYHNNAKYYKNGAMDAATSAAGSAYDAEQDALKSEGYAVGKQNGTDVSSGTYYHNNSKYFAIEAYNHAGDADNAKIDAVNAKNAAASSKLDSEAYAVGKRNGADVTSGDAAYHNNSKYYAGEASSSASSASSSESNAQTYSYDAEAWAKGTRNSVDVTSGTDGYHDNAKYYSTQAASSASSASGSATAAAASATAAAASASAIAADYDSTKTYAVGEYCLYSGAMYRCTTAITTAEAWTAGHWTQVKVGTELTDLKEEINDIDSVLGSEIVIFSDDAFGTAEDDGSEFEITVSGIGLFIDEGYAEYVNASLDGFYVSGLGLLPNTLGLIFGKDASKNYYFLALNKTGCGDVFQVTPSGSYTRIITNSFTGSGFTKVKVVSFAGGILSFQIYNSLGNVGTVQTRDVSSYGITPCVGFIPYTTDNFTFNVPKANFLTFNKIESAYNEVAELEDAYKTNDAILSDPTYASASVSDGKTTIAVSGISLFSNSKPIYTNAKIDNYYIDGITSFPSTLGLVVGLDASGNYYFMAVASTGIGQIFKVTPTGAYTRVDSSSFGGSNLKKIVIENFDNNILTYRIYSSSGKMVKADTRNMSSYGIVKKTIGFIPYAVDTFSIITPAKNYNSYKDFATVLELNNATFSALDKLLPLLVNTTRAYKIKLIGDSITAGFGGTGFDASESGGGDLIIGNVYQNVAGHCWANSFKSYIEAKFAGVTVINNGYSGATASFLYENINAFVSADDDIIICMIGTNNRSTTGDLNRLYTNLQSIVDYIGQLGIPLVLMSSIPASISNEELVSVLHMEDVNMVVGAIAKKNRLPWISVYDLMKEYLKYTETDLDSLLGDGLHPNDDGYDVMYQLITKAIGFTTPIEGYTWTPIVISKA